MIHLTVSLTKPGELLPTIDRMVSLPTDFDKESRIGSDLDDNTYLVVLGPDEKGRYMIFSVDKSTQTLPEFKDKNLGDLMKSNFELFRYQRLLTIVYTQHMKGNDVLFELEELLTKLDEFRNSYKPSS